MHMPSPIVLRWAVKQGLLPPAAQKSSWQCPLGVTSRLCKSDKSDCRQENGGYTCHSSSGYVGNPYVAHGCQGTDFNTILLQFYLYYLSCIHSEGYVYLGLHYLLHCYCSLLCKMVGYRLVQRHGGIPRHSVLRLLQPEAWTTTTLRVRVPERNPRKPLQAPRLR
jgi:hypothetical protein